jgi:hypothetical protein
MTLGDSLLTNTPLIGALLSDSEKELLLSAGCEMSSRSKEVTTLLQPARSPTGGRVMSIVGDRGTGDLSLADRHQRVTSSSLSGSVSM